MSEDRRSWSVQEPGESFWGPQVSAEEVLLDRHGRRWQRAGLHWASEQGGELLWRQWVDLLAEAGPIVEGSREL